MKNKKDEMVWSKELGIYLLPKGEEKGLKDVKAFQLNDFDTVAAYTLDEAKSWYLETTGIDEEDAFVDVCERSLSTKIWEDENMENKITLQEAINRYWKGEPFIVASTES